MNFGGLDFELKNSFKSFGFGSRENFRENEPPNMLGLYLHVKMTGSSRSLGFWVGTLAIRRGL